MYEIVIRVLVCNYVGYSRAMDLIRNYLPSYVLKTIFFFSKESRKKRFKSSTTEWKIEFLACFSFFPSIIRYFSRETTTYETTHIHTAIIKQKKIRRAIIKWKCVKIWNRQVFGCTNLENINIYIWIPDLNFQGFKNMETKLYKPWM